MSKETPTPTADLSRLGRRKIEEGELDPLIQAEAIKMSRWAHHDAVIAVKAILNLGEDDELSPEQTTVIKKAIFGNKYEYLCNKEESTDPY